MLLAPCFAPLVLFLLLVPLASVSSYSPQDSLNWMLGFLGLLAFAWTLPVGIHTARVWRRTALLVVVFSVLIPVFLSMARWVVLTWEFDFGVAVRHRLALAELGGSNLTARSLITGAPLLVAGAWAISGRKRRAILWVLIACTLLVFATYQSWSGWIGVGLTCLFVSIARYGRPWIRRWRTRRSDLRWYVLHVLAITIIITGILALLRLAPRVRVTSFNGRLLKHWAALNQISDHLLLGVGPGHYHLQSQYYPWSRWLVETQVTLDDPLLPLYHLRRAMTDHTHDLLLEIAVGVGLVGLLFFVWFLVELIRFGLRVRVQLHGRNRILATGCLAGIVATLGWGVIDVMRASSPFLTFPAWALVGLLLAAPRAFGIDDGRRTNEGLQWSPLAGGLPLSSVLTYIWRTAQHATHTVYRIIPSLPENRSRIAHHISSVALTVLCLGLAFVVVVMPLLGNLYYRAAYTAYQEQRWAAAAEELRHASHWDPFNAEYHQFRAEALINLGRYDEAIAGYDRAIRLKRGFSPYHAQLGWLHWLQGDLKQATMHFQQAVEMDPREAWRDGLHAHLGLAYVAQGRLEEALPLFKGTIDLDPQMALAPYWVPVQGADGTFDVVLDPVYLNGPSRELDKRILAHLGKADYTERLFDLDAAATSTLSFNRVLDAIEADYSAALASRSREASRLLATVAEAARLVGLQDRAERTHLAFQEAFPKSAYGFRDLGTLYREVGRLEEAQFVLERAVQVSPRDAASWIELTRVYLDRGMEEEAEEALDTIHRLKPLSASLYDLRAQLYQGRGKVAQATGALRKSLFIQESIANRLTLAGLYDQLGRSKQATEQCVRAATALVRTWPRLLDPQLWAIGLCLAESDGELPQEITSLARERPSLGNVLLGHTYRVQGLHEQALQAYQTAARARPDEAVPHYFLGGAYQTLGQPEPALAEFRQAALLDPLEPLPLLALGRIQWAQGDQEAALETFRAAVEAAPGWSQARAALGNALLALGDREGAGQQYQQAQVAAGDLAEGVLHDLAALLGDADVEAPGPGYVQNEHFTIGGDERRVLFMHPDSRAHFTVRVPEGAVLVFDVATAPASWDQAGDGVAFALYVTSGQGTRRVFSTYIDPKRDGAARRWHPYVVDLSDYAGQTVKLTLETGGGPAGDSRFDWAGWGAPRLRKP
jgi:tetratricopeptide (TPR) repeat protein/O-antigen ligase